MPPAISTTSCPCAWCTGQEVPNGPRRPTHEPFCSFCRAREVAPTARIVCTSCSGRAGSPLIEIGTSPTPNTYSMLNWPGANGRKRGSASGVSVSVKVSPVSRAMWRTSKGSGRIGSEARTVAAAGSVSVAIEVQELHARGFQARHHQLREALQQVVAEGRFVLALGAQAPAVQRQGADHRHGSRVESGL